LPELLKVTLLQVNQLPPCCHGELGTMLLEYFALPVTQPTVWKHWKHTTCSLLLARSVQASHQYSHCSRKHLTHFHIYFFRNCVDFDKIGKRDGGRERANLQIFWRDPEKGAKT